MNRPHLTRRRFLAGLGAATGVAVVAGYRLDVWGGGASSSSPAEPAHARARRSAGPVLVVLELAGGNDGLSMVVPHADPRYRRLRRTLGIENPIDLDGEIGLHPELETLAQSYRAGSVAVVEGVGVPDPDLSHFASMAAWWAGDPGSPTGPGWLGRYLDAAVGYDDPLAGITVGRFPSPAMAGSRSYTAAVSDRNGLDPLLDIDERTLGRLLDGWSRLADAPVAASSRLAPALSAIGSAQRARAGLKPMLAALPNAQEGTDVSGEQRDLASLLTLAATLAGADPGPRVVFVRFEGDFDTHEDHAARYPELMRELDRGLAAFAAEVERRGASDRVVLMTTSEFGRRAQENGTGIDHGAASSHLVIGRRVRGGRYGEPPSLTSLDRDGNLRATVDLRAYYATMLGGWLGEDSGPLVGDFAPLALLRERART